MQLDIMFYLLFVGVLSNNNILCLCGADECMGYEDMKGSLQSFKVVSVDFLVCFDYLDRILPLHIKTI